MKWFLGSIVVVVAVLASLLMPSIAVFVDDPFGPIGMLRIQRTTNCFAAGSLLGACGVGSQILFQNDLADPTLTGVSSGSVLGAAVYVVLLPALEVNNSFGLALASFVGALVVFAFVLSVDFLLNRPRKSVVRGAPRRAGRRGNGNSYRIILVGLCISGLCTALIALLFLVARRDQLQRMTFWTFGSFESLTVFEPLLLSVVSITLIVFFVSKSTRLDLLALGELKAKTLGVPVTMLRGQIALAIALGVACCTAICGPIAFVSLIGPHVGGAIVGFSSRRWLLASALVSAVLCLSADSAGRAVSNSVEIPAGTLTTIVGAIVLLSILVGKREELV